MIIPHPGGPEVLQLAERPIPVPGPHEVLVRVRSSALNRADLLQRMGRYPAPADSPPDIPGIEFAGEVSGLGSAATRWELGARVFGITGGGAHAEHLVAHEDAVARVPGAMSWNDAGAVPEAFITAHDALVTQAHLAPGDRVLIHAVGSGVGLAACQIVRAAGAIPFGTSRTAEKIGAARVYGLEDGIAIADDFSVITRACKEWSAGRGMNVVLDLAGGPYVAPSIESLGLKGRMMLVGAVAGATATIDVRAILGKRLTLTGTVLRARNLAEKIEATATFARDVVPHLEQGTMRPTTDSVFPLERLADAHRRMESNATFGKVVIEV